MGDVEYDFVFGVSRLLEEVMAASLVFEECLKLDVDAARKVGWCSELNRGELVDKFRL